jgi:tetratricopeptide (TPR) repeat protein
MLTFDCTRQINLRQWNVALELCQLARAVDPTFALAHAELGRVYTYGFRRLGDALAEYELADDLGGLNEAGLVSWAHTLDMVGRSTEAAELLDSRDIDGALANAIRGNAFRQQGHLEDAVRLYRRSLAEENNDPWVYHALAIAYLEMGYQEQAIACWQQALDLDPRFEPALRGITSLDDK